MYQYTPKIFYPETMNMQSSVTNEINSNNMRFGLHPLTKPVYINAVALDTHFFVPETLFYARSEAGYSKLSELTLDSDENVEKYKKLESFHFDFVSQLLHSNIDIINARKEYVEWYCKKRNDLFQKLNDKSYIITMYKKMELDGDDLRRLIKGNTRNEWIFLENIYMDFSFTSCIPIMDKNKDKNWMCKMHTNLNYCLMPSIQHYLGKFRYGIDAKPNEYISKIEFEIQFWRPQLMDHIVRKGFISSGGGIVVANDNLIKINKIDGFFSFDIEAFLFVKGVYDTELNLMNLA
eukprot:281739_1